MSMYTAQCIVINCDVPGCKEQGEVLARSGAVNTIPGWLEVWPMGSTPGFAQRKFICPTHAQPLGLANWETPAEIPLSQALQNPRFQRPETMAFMTAMDPAQFGEKVLRQGSKVLEAATKQAAGELPAPKEGEGRE